MSDTTYSPGTPPPDAITRSDISSSSDTMRACVLYGVARMEIRDVPRPEPGPLDVLVKVRAVGICGTDFHIVAGHANYNTDPSGTPIGLDVKPQILGHEIAGVIEEAGCNVKDLRPGDRVVVDQGLNCHSAQSPACCEYCASGNSHQCEYYRELGITGLPGGLADYVSVPAVNAVRIDSDLDMAEAALTEPLGCIVHSSGMAARTRSRYQIGGRDESRVRAVFIAGAGPAGLLFTQYLRNVLGYDGLLLVSEPNPLKRQLASDFGADTIDPNEVNPIEAVRDLTNGRGVAYLIEASGSGGIFTLIPGMIRKQALVLLYGHGNTGLDLSVINGILFREPSFVASVGASGSFTAEGRPTTYIQALKLIEEGRIKVSRFITHRYRSIESVPAAFSGDHLTPDYVKGVAVL
ncbi:MAG TPA: alcohol dehydrogenase catalytic domain-containing protein [Blastocatellia bacterium]|nr:alcohol dehydrogenase catalytic domain-containing protein [Blastocatellia bacterium]